MLGMPWVRLELSWFLRSKGASAPSISVAPICAGARSCTVSSTSANGVPFGFTDDVAVDASGRYAYFSDASSRWGYGQDGEAVIEHGGDGRLLRYDFSTGNTEVLLDQLQFANGVALGPDERYVLVNETGAYRISRYWLKGERPRYCASALRHQ